MPLPELTRHLRCQKLSGLSALIAVALIYVLNIHFGLPYGRSC